MLGVAQLVNRQARPCCVGEVRDASIEGSWVEAEVVQTRLEGCDPVS